MTPEGPEVPVTRRWLPYLLVLSAATSRAADPAPWALQPVVRPDVPAGLPV